MRRGQRVRAAAVVAAAVFGLLVLAGHRPGGCVGSGPDRDVVAAAAWAAWLISGYLLLAATLAGASCLLRSGITHRQLPATAPIGACVARWVGVTAAGLTAVTVSASLPVAAAASPTPQPPTVPSTVSSLDWTPLAAARPPVDRVQPVATRTEQLTVRPGDSLWAIAATELGAGASARRIAMRWPLWWSANRAVIGSNPDLIHPGQRLTAPASPMWRT